jgi:FkbM family methyltransferase
MASQEGAWMYQRLQIKLVLGRERILRKDFKKLSIGIELMGHVERVMVNRLIGILTTFYSGLPIKPFRGALKKLYDKYEKAGRNRVVVTKIKGITYELDLNEFIDSSIYYKGCFEPMVTATMCKYVKPGMTVLDIGANIGCHTLRYAKLVGSNGKVIAFEPMQWAISKLKRNIELNGFKNIVLEKIALSDVNAKRSVYFRSSWTLDNGSTPDSKTSEDIDFVKLDEYVDENKLDKIDFIKLDVDGYECKVIRGGMHSLKKFKPIMIIEFGKYTLNQCGDSLESLIDLLSSAGYSFYSEKSLKPFVTRQSLIDAVPENNTINVLCKQ